MDSRLVSQRGGPEQLGVIEGDPRRERARWLAVEVLPHERSLRTWLRWHRSGADADDVVQETYAILASLESVEHIRNPRNYMFQTARSVIYQQARRDSIVRFQGLGAAADPASEEASPEVASILRDELRRADRLLAALPDRMREAFVLRRIEGMSQREIARRMSISENTVEKHIGKALKVLLQSLVEADGGSTPAQVSKLQEKDDRRRFDASGEPLGRRPDE